MRTLRPVLLALLLLGFWFSLSGKTEPLFIGMGFGSAFLVTWFAAPLLSEVLGDPQDTPKVDLLRLVAYMFWLVLQIPPAALDVARTILVRSRRPRPGVVRFSTGLHSPAARTLLANSITLVPGTMTLSVVGGDFVVHALTPRAAKSLADAELQRRIAKVFRIPPDEPPMMVWDPLREQLPEEPQ